MMSDKEKQVDLLRAEIAMRDRELEQALQINDRLIATIATIEARSKIQASMIDELKKQLAEQSIETRGGYAGYGWEWRQRIPSLVINAIVDTKLLADEAARQAYKNVEEACRKEREGLR